MKRIKTLNCIGYSGNGHGLVDDRGRQVEVPNLLKGETARVQLMKRDGAVVGRVVAHIATVKDRVTPPCPHFANCGGCQLQHFSDAAQRAFKQKIVYKALKSFGKIQPLETMASGAGYRNKCVHSFSRAADGEIVYGLYQNHSHQVVPFKRCYIHDPRADAVAATLRDLMVKLDLKPYDEDDKRGHIRHLLTRVAQGSGQLLVTIVAAMPDLPHCRQLVEGLVTAHPAICGIVLNVNPKRGSALLARRQKVLYGKDEIVDQLAGMSFKMSSQSFYQVNRLQTEKLYRYALKLAAIKPQQRYLDAYCGIGTISLLAARRAKQVIGVELNPTAVANAKANAELNGIDNVDFVTADAADYLSEQPAGSFDGILLDPPREGCSKALIDALIKQRPSKIVYISCNPTTQARDLKQLRRAGYKVAKLKPFDLFVYTSHVEVVALLEKAEHYEI